MSERLEPETEQTEDIGSSQDEEPEQWGSDQARQQDDRDIRTGDKDRGPAEEDEDQAI